MSTLHQIYLGFAAIAIFGILFWTFVIVKVGGWFANLFRGLVFLGTATPEQRQRITSILQEGK